MPVSTSSIRFRPPPTLTPDRVLQSVVVAGGNLFSLAAIYLGDATQWNRIAAQNGLFEPMIANISNGPVQLWIPAVDPDGGNGGILGV